MLIAPDRCICEQNIKLTKNHKKSIYIPNPSPSYVKDNTKNPPFSVDNMLKKRNAMIYMVQLFVNNIFSNK
jgi:hypothetical protein